MIGKTTEHVSAIRGRKVFMLDIWRETIPGSRDGIRKEASSQTKLARHPVWVAQTVPFYARNEKD